MITIQRRHKVGRYKIYVNPFPPAAPFLIFKIFSRSNQGAKNSARQSAHNPENTPTDQNTTSKYSKVALYNAVFTPSAPQRTRGETEEIQSTVC